MTASFGDVGSKVTTIMNGTESQDGIGTPGEAGNGGDVVDLGLGIF